jgi:hypothetical protein
VRERERKAFPLLFVIYLWYLFETVVNTWCEEAQPSDRNVRSKIASAEVRLPHHPL